MISVHICTVHVYPRHCCIRRRRSRCTRTRPTADRFATRCIMHMYSLVGHTCLLFLYICTRRLSATARRSNSSTQTTSGAGTRQSLVHCRIHTLLIENVPLYAFDLIDTNSLRSFIRKCRVEVEVGIETLRDSETIDEWASGVRQTE